VEAPSAPPKRLEFSFRGNVLGSVNGNPVDWGSLIRLPAALSCLLSGVNGHGVVAPLCPLMTPKRTFNVCSAFDRLKKLVGLSPGQGHSVVRRVNYPRPHVEVNIRAISENRQFPVLSF
jgi:hypothetical protein